ncbi:UDP-glucosyltransferase 2-like isoform X1 [Hermetia illucens]|uniref:UDP-glucosyltransferase 2-like isoform X1 n=1 Tax=Hermetia illucens TaxID=343691 RepID=UPI0018CC4DB4|nr:UDP-glucosyltransferase 2-like isoform X1 [Hermetia illucens]
MHVCVIASWTGKISPFAIEMSKWKNSLAIILLLLTKTHCLKILGLFPHPGISHFHFFHPIMRALAEAGHDVTVVSHFPDKSPPMHYKDIVIGGVQLLNDTVDLQKFENRPVYSIILDFFKLHEWGKNTCEHTLKSIALRKVLKSPDKFDVILVEQFNTDCMMGVAYELKAPTIALSSCALMPWHYERFGAPLIPSYMPIVFHGHSEDMNFFQRLVNWFSSHLLQILYEYYSQSLATALLRSRFSHDMPEVSELVKETNLMFVNQHFSLSGAKPLPPSIIELGGIHIQKAKTLDVEIQHLLEGAKHGVVYISWGSMIRAESLPVEKREAILHAMGRLPQTVLWKWENETIPRKPSNVHIRKWMPQREILCHPNVKVFLSHGGLMGSSEAAYCGVPVILTPMYGDQFLNAASLKNRGMGIILNYEDITEANIFRAVKQLLEPRYHENAKSISFAFRNRPQKALDTAVWWVEYMAKTEGAPLTKSVATHISRFVYYSLDIYAFLIGVLLFSTAIWIFLFKWFQGRYRERKYKKD